jgi:hypothetical protein
MQARVEVAEALFELQKQAAQTFASPVLVSICRPSAQQGGAAGAGADSAPFVALADVVAGSAIEKSPTQLLQRAAAATSLNPTKQSLLHGSARWVGVRRGFEDVKRRLDALAATDETAASSVQQVGVTEEDRLKQQKQDPLAPLRALEQPFGARGLDFGGMPLSCVGLLTIAAPSNSCTGSSSVWPVALGPGAPALVDLLPRLSAAAR